MDNRIRPYVSGTKSPRIIWKESVELSRPGREKILICPHSGICYGTRPMSSSPVGSVEATELTDDSVGDKLNVIEAAGSKDWRGGFRDP